VTICTEDPAYFSKVPSCSTFGHSLEMHGEASKTFLSFVRVKFACDPPPNPIMSPLISVQRPLNPVTIEPHVSSAVTAYASPDGAQGTWAHAVKRVTPSACVSSTSPATSDVSFMSAPIPTNVVWCQADAPGPHTFRCFGTAVHTGVCVRLESMIAFADSRMVNGDFGHRLSGGPPSRVSPRAAKGRYPHCQTSSFAMRVVRHDCQRDATVLRPSHCDRGQQNKRR